ncbi:hypothetical protein FG05_12468 [Fusarium graminearum]|nr:hypothetical protein FG05_12468 [Fusarium graminearum]
MQHCRWPSVASDLSHCSSIREKYRGLRYTASIPSCCISCVAASYRRHKRGFPLVIGDCLFDVVYEWETKYPQQMMLPRYGRKSSSRRSSELRVRDIGSMSLHLLGSSIERVAEQIRYCSWGPVEERHSRAKSRWNAMNQRSRARGHSIPTDVSLSPGSRLLPHISSSANDSAISKAVLHSL